MRKVLANLLAPLILVVGLFTGAAMAQSHTARRNAPVKPHPIAMKMFKVKKHSQKTFKPQNKKHFIQYKNKKFIRSKKQVSKKRLQEKTAKALDTPVKNQSIKTNLKDKINFEEFLYNQARNYCLRTSRCWISALIIQEKNEGLNVPYSIANAVIERFKSEGAIVEAETRGRNKGRYRISPTWKNNTRARFKNLDNKKDDTGNPLSKIWRNCRASGKIQVFNEGSTIVRDAEAGIECGKTVVFAHLVNQEIEEAHITQTIGATKVKAGVIGPYHATDEHKPLSDMPALFQPELEETMLTNVVGMQVMQEILTGDQNFSVMGGIVQARKNSEDGKKRAAFLFEAAYERPLGQLKLNTRFKGHHFISPANDAPRTGVAAAAYINETAKKWNWKTGGDFIYHNKTPTALATAIVERPIESKNLRRIFASANFYGSFTLIRKPGKNTANGEVGAILTFPKGFEAFGSYGIQKQLDEPRPIHKIQGGIRFNF